MWRTSRSRSNNLNTLAIRFFCLLVLNFSVSCNCLKAQINGYFQSKEIHSLVNPAGITVNQAVSTTIGFRTQQWLNLQRFRSTYANLITPFSLKDDQQALGYVSMAVLRDELADKLVHTGVQFTFGYKVPLRFIDLGFAMQGDYVILGLQPGTYTTDTQFDSFFGFDALASNGEIIQQTQINYFSISSGIQMVVTKSERFKNTKIGVALFTLNRPTLSFSDQLKSQLNRSFAANINTPIHKWGHLALNGIFRSNISPNYSAFSYGPELSYSLKSLKQRPQKEFALSSRILYKDPGFVFSSLGINYDRYRFDFGFHAPVFKKTDLQNRNNIIELVLSVNMANAKKSTKNIKKGPAVQQLVTQVDFNADTLSLDKTINATLSEDIKSELLNLYEGLFKPFYDTKIILELVINESEQQNGQLMGESAKKYLTDLGMDPNNISIITTIKEDKRSENLLIIRPNDSSKQ